MKDTHPLQDFTYGWGSSWALLRCSKCFFSAIPHHLEGRVKSEKTPRGGSCLSLPMPPASGAQGLIFVRSSTPVNQSHFVKRWPPFRCWRCKDEEGEIPALTWQPVLWKKKPVHLRGQPDLHTPRGYDHGAMGAGRGKHLTLSQKRRESCPKAVILTFIELHLKELVGIFQKDRMEKGPLFLHTVVPPYLWGRHSQILSGCLRPQRVPNPTNTMFSFIYTQLW